MIHPRHSRRAFLGTLSATPLVAPFLARPARAATPIPNLVVVTWPEGLETGWQPTGTETAFQFADVLAPLNPFRDRLLVLSGIKGGRTTSSCSTPRARSACGRGPSPRAGCRPCRAAPPSISSSPPRIAGSAPYKSLHFGVQTNRVSFISTPYVHFAGPQQPIPAEDDPGAMYELIFGGLAQDQAALNRLRAERRSVADFVKARLGGVRAQVAAEDRPKLDKHAEAVRAIERSLDGLGGKCAPLPPPAFTKAAAMADANFPAVIKLQTDLLVTALQCGVTHVATLQLTNTDSQTKIPGLITTRTVHSAMHDGTAPERVEINRFFGKQLAYVLERLKAVDVGGGRTLLDDTLVVMSSEMAVGGHWNEPIPFLLAGNGGGYLKMGRYVKVAGRPRHTKLLTSVLHATGVTDVQTFGEFTGADAQGELAAIKA